MIKAGEIEIKTESENQFQKNKILKKILKNY